MIDIFDNKIESDTCVMLEKRDALPWLERHCFTYTLTIITRINPFFRRFATFLLLLIFFKVYISVFGVSCGMCSVDQAHKG